MDIMEKFNFHPPAQKAETEPSKQNHLSIYWKCCHVFSRIYRNREASAYEGRCPKCQGKLHVPIGKGGTTQRTFIAG